MKTRFALALLVLLIMSSLSFSQLLKDRLEPEPAQPLGPASSRTYWLYGNTTSWNGTKPGPFVNATDGDNVTITLSSSDGATHNWYLDYNNSLPVSSNPTRSRDFPCQPPSYCVSITFAP